MDNLNGMIMILQISGATAYDLVFSLDTSGGYFESFYSLTVQLEGEECGRSELACAMENMTVIDCTTSNLSSGCVASIGFKGQVSCHSATTGTVPLFHAHSFLMKSCQLKSSW